MSRDPGTIGLAPLNDASPTLSACPFCHGSNVIMDRFGLSTYAASCETEDCQAIGPVAPTPEDAAEKWNGCKANVVHDALERLRDLNSFIQQSRSGKMLTAEDARQQDEMHRRIGDIIGILQAAATQ